MHRWDIINTLIQRNNYKSYLEIGYYKGWSFDQVKCKEKNAVDPNPCKTPEQEAWKPTKDIWHEGHGYRGDIGIEAVYKMTSDDFFSKLPGNASWDIIFIDGLHEASQVTKDIENSLKVLSPGGTIVLHDCNPPTYEHTTTGVDGCWTGDVYKAFIDFRRRNEEEFDCYCIDTDWGIGVIQKREKPAVGFMPMMFSTKISSYGKSEWEFFDKNRKFLLNLKSIEEFKTKMNERITDNNLSAK